MSAPELALLAVVGVCSAASLVLAVVLLAFHLTGTRLDDAPAEPTASRLSIIVPCRDEADSVEACVRSLLAQDLDDLEVVAVDDRSTDATGEILDRLAAADPRLRVVHVEDLPEGWLGKNHASHVGAREASGQWILFTDGDVVFEPTALARALHFATRHHLGHLVVFPHLDAQNVLERAFLAAFAVLLALHTRPWQLKRPRTGAFIGIGAFNLVARDALERIGGHTRLRFEVADDVKLGLILRRSGVAQGAIDSGGLVHLRWQPGFLASIRGLEKNAFAACEFRWPMAVAGVAGLAVAALTPPLALVVLPLPQALTALPALLVPMLMHAGVARASLGGTGIEGLLAPVSGLAVAAALARSTLFTAWRRGIVWRGTHYPIDALRRGCVRERDWPRSAAVGWE